MRNIPAEKIEDAVLQCIAQANSRLGERETQALRSARDSETNSNARAILDQLLDNARIAHEENRPLCQDTGVPVFFIDLGQDAHIEGQDLTQTINDAVRQAHAANRLRAGIVDHPLTRRNTRDNAPAIIHARIVPGDRLRIRYAAKGGGGDNLSRTAMLTPAQGREAVVEFVLGAVQEAGGKACPPLVVGIGLGGNFETAPLLAKESLLRPLAETAENPEDAALERELLERINDTGIGPMGLGGSTTALAVHVLSRPCHIAALPVAVNLDCHSHRHAEIIL